MKQKGKTRQSLEGSKMKLRPIITESALQKVKSSVYSFYVHTHATKHQIKETIEKLFDVIVKGVHTHVRKGKLKKKGKRMIKTRMTDTKIAYIHVSKGKIDLFPQA